MLEDVYLSDEPKRLARVGSFFMIPCQPFSDMGHKHSIVKEIHIRK